MSRLACRRTGFHRDGIRLGRRVRLAAAAGLSTGSGVCLRSARRGREGFVLNAFSCRCSLQSDSGSRAGLFDVRGWGAGGGRFLRFSSREVREGFI